MEQRTLFGDRGTGEACGGEPERTKTIAKGNDVCHLRYHKKSQNRKEF